jgi:hypothetical protein
MRGTLDPITLGKIEAFARRRKRLILIRGICAVLTILLTSMMALAFVDWRVLLPDEVRWGLSLAAYGAAFVAAWYTCARLIWHAPDARELARFIEQTRPELREDLLSAVELGDPRGQERWDSEEFREILQKNVAERIKSVQIESILSFKRISRWGWAATAVLLSCSALFMVPGFRFDHRLLRSLLPMANLERLSRVKIRVLEPDPHERTVPQGDVVAVRVEVSDPEVTRAYLESFPTGRKAEKVEMKQIAPREWESGVLVGHEPVAYRIRASDAITRKYLLTPVPRPEAITFHKTFNYPEYMLRKPRVAADQPAGDLEEFEGTLVDLKIRVNQEVSKGELVLEQGGKSSTLALERTGEPLVLATRVPITASGTYRVLLTGAQTGFENKFSPQYEIRSIPDLVPRITLDEPTTDLIVPPSEVIALKGTARDDVGLRQVEQLIRVNQGEWKEVVLSDHPANPQAIARWWDLHDLGVQPGDRVTTKLVAIDLKGNRAESSPLNIAITAPGFDPQRLVPLAAKEVVYEALVELRSAANTMEKKISEAAAQSGSDELVRKQALISAAGEAEKVSMQSDQVETRVKDALRLTRTAREANDLVLVARVARRLKEDSLQTARAEIERATSVQDAAEARENLKRSEASFRQALSQAAVAEESYRELLATEESIAILNDLRDMAREQANINRQALAAASLKDPKTWERLWRRQGVAVGQIEVDRVFERLEKHVPAGQGPRVAALQKALAQGRGKLKEALSSAPSEALMGPSGAMQRDVEGTLGAMAPYEQDLARRSERAREALLRGSPASTGDVGALGKELDTLLGAERRFADQKTQGEAAKLEVQRRLLAEQSSRTSDRWKGARVQLEARAAVEETRRDSDPFFVADSGLAGRALQAVADLHQAAHDAASSREKIRIVEKAYRTLETGHELAELSTGLRELAEVERWQLVMPSASTRSPKDWQWMDARMRTLPEEFRDSGLPLEAAQELVKNWRGPAGEQVRREMAERFLMGRRLSPVTPALEKLSADVGRALTKIQPALEEARKALEKLVPSLPERLRELAKVAEKRQGESKDLSKQTPHTEAAQVRPQARNLLEKQQGLDKQIEDVMTELRRDANTQNLFTEQGRERARDADDAIAMLQQSPAKAEDALNQASSAQDQKTQQETLEKASDQEGKQADALRVLAEHYKNLAEMKPEETRPELRKAEEALGLKEQLDKQYAQMAKLADLAQQSSESLRAALESELSHNEAMQRDLEQLAQNALDRAEAALNQAAQEEAKAAQEAAKQAQHEATQQRTAADQARKIAEEARRMARQDVPQLQKESQQAKTNEQAHLEKAAKDLEKGANDIPQNMENNPQAVQGLEQAAQDLQKAAQDFHEAQQQAHQAAEQAQKAEQTAARQAQKSQQAQQQAQQNAQQAQKAAQQAQKAAQQAPENPALQQAAQQAQKASEQAQQQAQAAQQARDQESAKHQAAQHDAHAAHEAEQHAGQAGQHAAELAQQAQQLANALKGQTQARAQQHQQAQQAQAQVGEMLQGAHADLRQAARDEAELGHEPLANALGHVAEGVQGVEQHELAAAQQAAQARPAPQQRETAQTAQAAIEAQAQALAQARQAAAQAHPAEGQPAEGTPLGDQAAQFMAEALNALNAEPGQPGQPHAGEGAPHPPGQGPGSPEAGQALASAAEAQAQSMRQGRQPGQGQAPGQMPGQMPFSNAPGTGKGASVNSGPLAEGQLPGSAVLKPGEWGKLPPRLARDLMEAQRESVSGEYRTMVETYFRVIAERAKDRK